MRLKKTDLKLSLLGIVTLCGLFIMPLVANTFLKWWTHTSYSSDVIAPLFTEQVQHWAPQIEQWSSVYGIDPNLMATIMQIESCGHPTVVSNAGARGLFQVMPFHFDADEDMLDPNVNALRSANFINECHGYASGDIGLILACYNGGPSVTYRAFDGWPDETKRYYVWGLTIYQDAVLFSDNSAHLDDWLSAGGVHLCNQASSALQLR